MKCRAPATCKARHAGPLGSFPLAYVPAMQWLAPDFPVSVLNVWEVPPESCAIPHLHVHNALEVGYCHAGTGILVVEDRVVSFATGDVVIINNTEMHLHRSANGTVSRWTYFWLDPPTLLASIPEGLEVADQNAFAGHGFPNVISPREHPDICQTVVRMIDEIRDQGPGHRMVLRGLAWVLMTLLHRMCQDRPMTGEAPSGVGVERVSPALRHLAHDYAEEIDVRELASLCHLSVTHFYRVFQAAVGTTPQEYQARLRCRMAAGMLREHLDRPIIEIAFATGFNAVNTFNRRFRETLGMSPRQWRGGAASGKAASA